MINKPPDVNFPPVEFNGPYQLKATETVKPLDAGSLVALPF